MKKVEVTGVMIQYYKICKRKLWFYINQINMSYDNDDIEIGKQIHENSYKREKKEFRVNNLVFDFIKNPKNDDIITIFEIKKSSKAKISSLYQLYYYLYILKRSKINAEGILVYPKEKKREKVKLTDDIINELEEIIINIQKISEKATPPKADKKNICGKCSYMELCLI